MSAPRRPGGLGRGLASLLGETDEAPSGELQTLSLACIKPSPANPRKSFDEAELTELAQSIKARGLVQPIVVRRAGESFEIVAGERRYRAAKQAGLTSVPTLTVEADDKTLLEIAIVENVQRADLSPLEEARGLSELVSRHGYTQDELAGVLSKSRSHVANTLRLLKLPEDVQALLDKGALSAGQARPLIGHGRASELAERAARDGLSAREVERLAKSDADTTSAARSEETPSSESLDIERRLQQRLGARVAVKGSGDKGRITLNYKSRDELQRWVALLSRP